MNVTDLITAGGLETWERFPEWAQLVDLAETVAAKINRPLVRAAFAAKAASDLAEIQPSTLEGKDFSWWLEAAEGSRPTPQGPRELWGSAMEGVRSA